MVDARVLAARVWQRRYRVEIEAMLRFERLALELQALGGLDPVIQRAATAADDERRHALLCSQLIEHFGEDVPVLPSMDPKPLRLPKATARECLLYEVVALCCVTETLSTALLGTMREVASDDATLSTMRTILKDEVRHSQLGWAHLAAEHAAGCRDVVGQRLAAMLAETVQAELFSALPEHPLQSQLDGFGMLGRQKRCEIFVETMDQVVFPGLARYGVDVAGGRDWLAKQLPRDAQAH